MEFRDYYKTLGVERTATEAEIKSAYRKLARKFHPDVNPNNKQAEQRFKEINEAYQVLGDAEKRRKYDQLGADWERGTSQEDIFRQYAGQHGAAGAGFAPGGGFSDFFERFFGGGGFSMGGAGRGRRGFRGADFGDFDFGPGAGAAAKAPDLEAEVAITVREAMHGARRRLALTAQDDCPQCGGTGMVAHEEQREKMRVIRSDEPCRRCNGRGTIAAHRTLEVTIPPGMTDGDRMRLKGQGGKGPRPDLNGDLFLTVRIQPDPAVSIAGRDVRIELPVWDYEAALGAEVVAPTLDGRIALKIPAGSQGGRVMRLRGRGIPARGKQPAGDLLYELKVLAPTDLNDDERRLMEQFAERRKARGVRDPRSDLMRES